MSNSIEGILGVSMEKIREMVDVNTIIGDPIAAPNGTTIIPISKVSIGYVVGGGEYADLSARRVSNHFPLAGGSSGGMSVSPVGFLVISQTGVSFVNVENKTATQTIINAINTILEKINNYEKTKK